MNKTMIEVGKKAVREAMRASRLIQQKISEGLSLSKTDKSPVTVADFTAQAIICRILNENFPDIPIVAEESAEVLRQKKDHGVGEKIIRFIEADERIKKVITRDNLYDSIDFGTKDPGEQFWTLDPIDGTKGFLRGEQYAIALAFIERGEVKIGILGCPNLQLTSISPDRGYIFWARLGHGTTMEAVASKKMFPSKVSTVQEPEKMRFVQSYESSHGNMPLQLKIARILNMGKNPVQMDSQVKYGIVSTGDAEIYIRIPHPQSPDYKEKIWDHAAGSLIVTEAGGIVTDIYGKRLDFSTGKTLARNTGVLVAVPKVHDRLLEIIRELI